MPPDKDLKNCKKIKTFYFRFIARMVEIMKDGGFDYFVIFLFLCMCRHVHLPVSRQKAFKVW